MVFSLINNEEDVIYFKPESKRLLWYPRNVKIKNIQVEGVSGGNLVKVVLSGDYELKSIVISESAKNESQDIINDLIIAAYNNAKDNLKKK